MSDANEIVSRYLDRRRKTQDFTKNSTDLLPFLRILSFECFLCKNFESLEMNTEYYK